MKKIKLIMISALAIFYSCQDFLTEVDPNTVSSDTFWKTAEDAERGLNAVYSALQLDGISSRNGYMGQMVMSDEAIPNVLDGSVFHTMSVLDYVSNSAYVESVWSDMYVGIFRANQVLDALPEIDMSETLKTRYEAEARFIRGWLYFWLANIYNNGEIILHTTVPVNESDFHKEVSGKAEVDSLIISDFLFAQANLPEVQEETGRVTWGAATAMLGKYYLFNEDWAKAQGYFKAIIDKAEQENLYALAEDYQWNFDEEHEFNSESIFEVAYSSVFKEGMSGEVQDGINGSEAANVERYVAARQNVGGWSLIVPSYHLMLDMMGDSMDMSNPVNEGRKYPVRASASMVIYDDTPVPYFNIELPPASATSMQFNQRSAGFIRKRTNWETRTQVDIQNNRSGLNERKIRLADVYLMYAEAVIKNTGDIAEAVKYINKVRERAAVVQLDPTGISSPDSVMNHLMYKERPFELSFEGQNIRWHDLRRWGVLGERFEELSNIAIFWASNTLPRYATESEVLSGDYRVRYLFEGAASNYNSEKNYWPIPTSELTSNGAFVE